VKLCSAAEALLVVLPRILHRNGRLPPQASSTLASRVEHKECNKVNLGLGASIRFQNYCLETDVEAFDQIPVFTTPQIVWMTWLK
jgi:uncharacterized ferritin-like protein (DUF455 family)